MSRWQKVSAESHAVYGSTSCKNMNIVELITKLIVFMEAAHVFVQNIQDQLKPNHVVAVVLAVIYTNKVIVVVIVIVVLTKNS